MDAGIAKQFTTVTNLSKFLALVLFVSFPFIGFYLGIKYESINSNANVNVQRPDASIDTYTVIKSAVLDLYKYELVKTDFYGSKQVIYTIVNTNGFGYDLSADKKYIAILNYSEAMGDETLTLINSDGKIIKDFGHLNSPQTLVPLTWTDHFYWLSQGIPIGSPAGVIRVNADTLQVDYYGVNPQ